MPRRRRNPAITLSAFQDVIMSVSGLVIVIVLLLTLELIDLPSVESAVQPAAVANQLREAIRQAQAEAAELEAELQSDEELIARAAELPIESLKHRIARQLEEIERLRDQNDQLSMQVDAQEQSEQAAQLELFHSQPMQEERQMLRSQVERIRERIESDRNDQRPLFSLPRGVNKAGWLVVISANGIEAAPLGREAVPFHFSGRSVLGVSTTTAADEFLEWSQRLNGQVYFLLLIRPGGSKYFDSISETLDRRGLSYGFDLIDVDESILHPQRGGH